MSELLPQTVYTAIVPVGDGVAWDIQTLVKEGRVEKKENVFVFTEAELNKYVKSLRNQEKNQKKKRRTAMSEVGKYGFLYSYLDSDVDHVKQYKEDTLEAACVRFYNFIGKRKMRVRDLIMVDHEVEFNGKFINISNHSLLKDYIR